MLLTALVAGGVLYVLYRLVGDGCVTRMVLVVMALVLALGLLGSIDLDPGEGPTDSALLALGDSFSSGEGAGPPWEETADGKVHRCRRSPRAYGPLLQPGSEWEGDAQDLGRDVANLACQGAVADEVSDQYAELDPAVRRRTDLVVMTMGGNDAGFSDVLVNCIGRVGGDTCLRDYRPGRADLLSYVIGVAGRAVGAELRQVAADFPEARILLLSYPPIFAGSRAPIDCDFALPGPIDYLTGAELEYLAAKGIELNRTLERVVGRVAGEGHHVEFVPVDGAFVGHELCRTVGSGPGAEQVSNADAWLNDIRIRFRPLGRDPVSFHPTAEGYEAMATCLADHVERGANDC